VGLLLPLMMVSVIGITKKDVVNVVKDVSIVLMVWSGLNEKLQRMEWTGEELTA
jgi:hypothetical protein